MSRVSVEILTAGDGVNYPVPGKHWVTIHYVGTRTADGSQFDSTRDRGRPFTFKLGAEQVIPGLDMGVAQLSIKERAKIQIPAALAYGSNGFPGLIEPNAALTFDVELLTFSE